MLLLDLPWVLFFLLLIVLSGVVDIGYRIGLRLSVDSDSLRHDQLVAVRDSIGLLLSLLLGFTLAMAISRFDLRKQLIVDEANAIGTTSLRAQMLAEPVRDKVLPLLRRYVDERLRYSHPGLYNAEVAQSIARAKSIQNQLWSLAVDLAKTTPNPITSLYVQTLNDAIDLSEKRLAALENRVPSPIWVMLALISALECLVSGMTTRPRFWFAMLITPLMIAIVMTLIADLNSPRSGFLQTGGASIERLRHDLQIK